MSAQHCRLYLITPPRLMEPGALDPFADEMRAALGAGDVACVQLRLKSVSDDVIRRAGEALMPIVQAAGAAFLVNDRPDIAKALGADGVHIGQEDAPYARARALLGEGKIVGVTCHNSRHLAMEAAGDGADYVAFGAFYPTATKTPPTMADIEIIRWWAELMEVPCVAIGGITPFNAAPLIEAGADFIAASSGVWDFDEGPAAAVRAFNAAMSG